MMTEEESRSSKMSAESQENQPEISNPLQIPAILSKIFKYCDQIRDLPQCRQVCKSWKDASREQWNRKLVIKVEQRRKDSYSNSYSYTQALEEEYPPGTVFIRKGLEELMDPSFDMPGCNYANFLLEKWDLAGEWTEKEVIFWNSCGASMRELTLISCKFQDVASFLKLVLEKTPNLRKLTIDEQKFQHQDLDDVPLQLRLNSKKFWLGAHENLSCLQVVFSMDDQRLPISWFPILRHFPKIKELDLDFGEPVHLTKNNFGSLEKFLIALKSHRQKGGMQLIERLDIWPFVWTEDRVRNKSCFELLQDLKLPLKKLTLDIGVAPSRPALAKLLKSYANTMENLVLTTISEETGSRRSLAMKWIPFSEPWKHLHTLELVGNVTSNFSLLRFTPNLKRLSFAPLCQTKYFWRGVFWGKLDWLRHDKRRKAVIEWGMNPEMAQVKLEKLVELDIGYGLSSPTSVSVFGKWMPNVKKLTIPASNAGIFGQIVRTWTTSLEEMKLLAPAFIDDQVITGLKRGCVTPGSARLSNITDLKNLRSFEMQHPYSGVLRYDSCPHMTSELTDRSIRNGFLGLEKLHTLKIYLRKPAAESTMQSLKEKRGLVTLSAKVVSACKCKALYGRHSDSLDSESDPDFDSSDEEQLSSDSEGSHADN